MTAILPVFFSLAGTAAVFTIWNAVLQNISTVKMLASQIKGLDRTTAITVNLLQNEPALEPVAIVRRPRLTRVPHPKPITHRLHQFDHSRSVA